MTHRIIIVGGGAGGLELATQLGRTLGRRGQADVTLVDVRLTHIWKPLLHEVAAGSLDASADELNYLAQAKWNHFAFQLGRLVGLDRQARTIRLDAITDESGQVLMPARALSYDTLIIAVGSRTNDFGTPGASEHCTFLDSPEEAREFHRRLLGRYLAAHAHEDGNRRINIAIVGAGATGVELAAELRNAARELSAYGLRGIAPGDMHITLLDAGARVLPALPERIGVPVHRTLETLGVRVKTSARVKEITADGLHLESGEFIASDLKVWAAGIQAPAFLAELDGLETNRLNQLVVRPSLQTTLDDAIFAMGDCAACPLGDGSDRTVPPRAQAAHQQAALLARSLRLRLAGEELSAYRYTDYGSLISLSRFSAVGNLMGNLMGSVKFEGWLARMFYVSLYRMHQRALYGTLRTILLMLSDRIGRSTEPRLKMH